jgi:hypothetical protein
MIKTLKIIFIFSFLMNLNLYSQNNVTRHSTGSLYQDLSRDINIKDARFVLVIKSDSVHIDTTTLRKIDPDWVDKVEMFTLDKNQIDSPIASIYVYIGRKYYRNVNTAIGKE